MRLLGLDIGERRIGVAISDPEGIIAIPLTQISRKGERADLEAILDLTRQHEVGGIVIGMPYSLDGRVGKQAEQVQDFVKKLSQCTELPIETWDERLSTVAAEKGMREAGLKRGGKEKVDALAAAFILQGYLDRMHPSE